MDTRKNLILYTAVRGLGSDFDAQNNPDIAKSVSEFINTVDAHRLEHYLFDNLNDARKYASIHSESTGIVMVVELELSQDDLSDLKNNTSTFDANRASKAIKALHFANHMRLPIEDTKLAVCEKKNLDAILQSDIDNRFVLNQSPFLFLQKIPPDLLYLLFTDYELFDHRKQNWIKYHEREKGCLADLFKALQIVCEFLAAQTEKPVPMSLDRIKEMHHILSQHTSEIDPEGASKFRQINNSFPLNISTASKDGIKELLLRIKTDNNPRGFAMGERKHLGVIEQYCQAWGELAGRYHMTTGRLFANKAEYLKDMQSNNDLIIDEITKKSQEQFPGLTRNDIQRIITAHLPQLDFAVFYNDDQSASYDVNSSPMVHTFFKFLSNIGSEASKEEAIIELKYAKINAAARAGAGGDVDISTYTDDQLNSLAQELHEQIKAGKTINIFPPDISIAEEMAKIAIARFNKEIQEAASTDDKISCIDRLIHEIEILHLFKDVNCRTCYILLNQLLMANGVKWSILYDPNRFDALSAAERIDEIKKGILRFEYVANNKQNLLATNDELSALTTKRNINFSTKPKYDNQHNEQKRYSEYYAQISAGLITILQNKTSAISKKIDELTEKYKNTPSSDRRIFASASSDTPENYQLMLSALVVLKADGNIEEFANITNSLLRKNPSVGIQRDIDQIYKIMNLIPSQFMSVTKTSPARYLPSR